MFIRIYSPQLTTEQKALMSRELTALIVQILKWPEHEKQRCTIYFINFDLENIAAAGVLASESLDPVYEIVIIGIGWIEEIKILLAKEITKLLLSLLNIGTTSANRIHILFREYNSDQLAVGGTLLSHKDKV